MVIVYQKRLFPAAASTAKTDLEGRGVFVHRFQDGPDRHAFSRNILPVQATVDKEEFRVLVNLCPAAPKEWEVMPEYFTKVVAGHQEIIDHFFKALTDDFGLVVIDTPVFFYVVAGINGDGASVNVTGNGTAPGAHGMVYGIAPENLCIVVLGRLELFAAWIDHGDNPFVCKPGGHEQVVGIVVAVLDVENDFVSHTGNACELKT